MKTFLSWLGKPTSIYGILFLTLVVLAISLVNCIREYNRVGIELTRSIYSLESELSSEELWEKRNHWINREIPRFTNSNQAASRLMEPLALSLSDHPVDLEFKQLVPSTRQFLSQMQADHHFNHSSAQVQVRGPIKEIVKWIHGLQKPGEFTGVEQIEVAFNDGTLTCETTIVQWWAEQPSIDPGQHHQTEVHDAPTRLVKGL